MAKIYKNIKEKVEDVTKEGRLVIAINAIGNEDTDGDISMPGSFDKTLKDDIVRAKWYLNHDTTILLGVPISGREEDGLVKMEAQLNLKKQIGRDVLSDYELFAEFERTLEHSVGVEDILRNKSNTKQVLEWKFWECSTLTSWGANERTPLLEIKSVDDQIKILEKALKKSYSDERLSGMENSLSLLKKAVLGELIVKCPCCGLVFDYNTLSENTIERQIADAVGMYAQWMIDDIAYQEVQQLEPEIRNQVTSLFSKQKSMRLKSIEDIFSYVNCPKCYCQVHKINSISQTIEEQPVITSGLKSIGSKFLNK